MKVISTNLVLASGLILFFNLLFFFLISYAEEFQLVSNKSLPHSRISQKSLKALYLGKRKMVEELKEPPLLALYYTDDRQLEAIFTQLLEISPREYESLWRKKLFSGRSYPPVKLRTPKELESYLQSPLFSLVLSLEGNSIQGTKITVSKN